MWGLFPIFALSSGPLDPLFRIQKQTARVHNPLHSAINIMDTPK